MQRQRKFPLHLPRPRTPLQETKIYHHCSTNNLSTSSIYELRLSGSTTNCHSLLSPGHHSSRQRSSATSNPCPSRSNSHLSNNSDVHSLVLTDPKESLSYSLHSQYLLLFRSNTARRAFICQSTCCMQTYFDRRDSEAGIGK